MKRRPASPSGAAPLAPAAPAGGGRCSATTRRGKRCHLAAAPGERTCELHPDRPERVEARRRLLADRGRAGQAKRTARARADRAAIAAEVRLGTAAEIRAALERALGGVEASAADPLDKAHATAKLASVAVNVLRTVDLEGELARLRELVERLMGGVPATSGALS